MIRRRYRVVALALMTPVLAVVGCSPSSDSAEPSSSSSVPAPSTASTSATAAPASTSAVPVTPSPDLTGTAGFLDYMRRSAVFPDAVPDEPLVRAGEVVCERLDSGQKPEAVGAEMVKLEFTPSQAATLIVVAVKFLCPTHIDVVPAATGTIRSQ